MCALSREYCKPYLHLVFSVKYGWLIHSSCIMINYILLHYTHTYTCNDTNEIQTCIKRSMCESVMLFLRRGCDHIYYTYLKSSFF